MPRIYLQNADAPYTPAAIRGDWGNTGSAVLKAAGTSKSGSITAQTVSATTGNDYLGVRVVYGPLVAGDYTVGQFALGVAKLTGTHRTHAHMYIESSGGTLRGTLVDNYVHTVDVNAFSTAGQVIDPSSATVTAQTGDYLVAEYGPHCVASGLAYSYYGGTDATDLSAGAAVNTYTGWIDLTVDEAPPVPGKPTLANSGFNATDGLVVLTATAGSGETPDGWKFYRAGTLVSTQEANTYHIPSGEGGTANWTVKAYNENGDSLESDALSVTNAVAPTMSSLSGPSAYPRNVGGAFTANITGYANSYRFYLDGVLAATQATSAWTPSATHDADVTAIAANGYGDSAESSAFTSEYWYPVLTKAVNWYGAPNGQVGYHADAIPAEASVEEGGDLFATAAEFDAVFWSPAAGQRVCETPSGLAIADSADVASYLNSWLAFDKSEPFAMEGEVLFDGDLSTSGLLNTASIIAYPFEGLYSHEVRANLSSRLMYDKRYYPPTLRDELTSTVVPFVNWQNKWVKWGFEYDPGTPSAADPSRTISWIEIDGVRTDICTAGDYRSKWSEDLNFPHPALGIHRYTQLYNCRILAYRNYKLTTGVVASIAWSAHHHFPFTVRGNGSYAWMNNSDSSIYVLGDIRAEHPADAPSAIYTVGADDVLTTIQINVPEQRALKEMHVRAKKVYYEVLDADDNVLADGTTNASTEELVTVDLREFSAVGTFYTRLTLIDTTSMLRWWDVSWSTAAPVSGSAQSDSGARGAATIAASPAAGSASSPSTASGSASEIASTSGGSASNGTAGGSATAMISAEAESGGVRLRGLGDGVHTSKLYRRVVG